MTAQSIAAALERIRGVIRRRPGVAVVADAPAVARWEGALRVVSAHPQGMRVVTDLPRELGGAGEAPTPGWLLRAALASCAAARIALQAAEQDITLIRLEVSAASVSDARGFLGMLTQSGEPVSAAPTQVQLHVRISAQGVDRERLETLVRQSERCSPVTASLVEAVPVSLHIDVEV